MSTRDKFFRLERGHASYADEEAVMRFEAECERLEDAAIAPCRAPTELRTPIRLGSFYAGQALKHGCQDAYDNAIEARYGKGY